MSLTFDNSDSPGRWIRTYSILQSGANASWSRPTPMSALSSRGPTQRHPHSSSSGGWLGRRVHEIARVVIDNLGDVEEDLLAGAVVVFGDETMRIRRLPIG